MLQRCPERRHRDAALVFRGPGQHDFEIGIEDVLSDIAIGRVRGPRSRNVFEPEGREAGVFGLHQTDLREAIGGRIECERKRPDLARRKRTEIVGPQQGENPELRAAIGKEQCQTGAVVAELPEDRPDARTRRRAAALQSKLFFRLLKLVAVPR